MRIPLYSLIAACALTSTAWAGGVQVEDAWVRTTLPGQKVTGAFMQLTADADMALVKGASPAAKTVELHFMRMQDGMMEMRELKKIDLPKGARVGLEPGGLHVMLIGLKAPIQPGDKVPLTLTIKSAKGAKQTLPVMLEARSPSE